LQAGQFSQASDNSVGLYRRHFTLDETWAKQPLRIQFDGVETAMYLWCNGEFVGYAEDSFTPSAFDLTPFSHVGDNVLAVAVFKRSTASWLEDQDFFRFSGIFRSVWLQTLPAAHVVDLAIRPVLTPDLATGILQVTAKLAPVSAGAKVTLMLTDAAGTQIGRQNPCGRAHHGFCPHYSRDATPLATS
jgi:beta-galactosidase